MKPVIFVGLPIPKRLRNTQKGLQEMNNLPVFALYKGMDVLGFIPESLELLPLGKLTELTEAEVVEVAA